MVRVVEFPGEGNSISVGGMYDATQEIPRQAGEAWVARRHQQSCFCVFVCVFGVKACNSLVELQPCLE